MSGAGHSRARNVRFSVLIVSDAATLILSDAQHFRKITRNLSLTFATFGDTGQQADVPSDSG
jgi:hypothetical protein